MKHIKEFKSPYFVRTFAVHGRHFEDYSKEEIDDAIAGPTDEAWKIPSRIGSVHATPSQIEKVLDKFHGDRDSRHFDFKSHRRAAVLNPNASFDNIMQGVCDDGVVLTALKHKNVTHEHINAALHHRRSDGVWETAVHHPKATRENLENALDLDNDYVKDVARERLDSGDYADHDQKSHRK